MNDAAPSGGDPEFHEALTRVARAGVDPAPVREYAMGAVSRRMRRRRAAGTLGALGVLVASVALVGLGAEEPVHDEVVSPSEGDTTTTSRARPTTSTAATIAAPAGAPSVAPTTAPTSAVVTTNPSPTPVAPPPSAAARTPAYTGPRDEPGTPSGTLAVPGVAASGVLDIGSGAVGDLVEFRLAFSDPDGPDVEPFVSVRSADSPGETPPEPPTGACDGGPGTDAVLEGSVQFTRAGPQRVEVVVTYCEGPALVFPHEVDVAQPRHAEGPGRAVMALLADEELAEGGAEWSFRADDGSTPEPVVSAERVVHRSSADDGSTRYGILLVLPAGMSGVVTMQPDAPDSPGFAAFVPAEEPEDGSPTHVALQPQP
ncbi:MAG: hypothetical protein M9942_11855 [Microthrixaceae bacterium]|nr:hypothetical protein [Microthrixaceae bacterium]